MGLCPNLQIMQQNISVLKLSSKTPLFLKHNFNKIAFCVELDIVKIELYVLCTMIEVTDVAFPKYQEELDFTKIEFYTNYF